MITTAQRSIIPPQSVVWGLLLANGFLIALMLALAKAATSQGMPAITYAFWQTLIAGAVLLVWRGKAVLCWSHVWAAIFSSAA